MTRRMARGLLALMFACGAAAWASAQQPTVGATAFRTKAQFSKDADILRFSTAVALVDAAARANGSVGVNLYFYTFPLTVDHVVSVTHGSIALLERKRRELTPTARERNMSQAMIGLLINEDRTVSNASLVLPGVTCTIVAAPEYAAAAFEFRFDGRQVRLRGKGTHECDLTSVGMGKPNLGWDLDVDVPAFIKK